MLKTPEIRDEIRSSLETLCAHYKIGSVLARPEPLSGGYLHKLWRVETQEGTFVIKKLNPAIMEKRGMAGRLEQAESIGAAFREAGIPAVIPYAHDGSFINEMDDASYLLYPFVSGSLYDLNRVSKSQASQVAGLLARMHTLHLPIQKEVGLHYDIVPEATWRDLIAQCIAKNLSFSQDLERLLPFFLHCNEQHAANLDELNAHLVLGHRDLHPENILWETPDMPHIIDWEYAGLVNPTQEIIGAALEWSGLITRDLDPGCFNAFMDAYKQAGGIITIDPVKAFYTFFANNMLSWTEINITRALGLTSQSTKEQAFAAQMLEEIVLVCDYLQSTWSSLEQILKKVNEAQGSAIP